MIRYLNDIVNSGYKRDLKKINNDDDNDDDDDDGDGDGDGVGSICMRKCVAQ